MPNLLPPGLSNGALAFLLVSAFIAAMARGFSGFGAALTAAILRPGWCAPQDGKRRSN